MKKRGIFINKRATSLFPKWNLITQISDLEEVSIEDVIKFYAFAGKSFYAKEEQRNHFYHEDLSFNNDSQDEEEFKTMLIDFLGKEKIRLDIKQNSVN